MTSELRTERRDATLLLTISDPATRNSLSDQVHAAGVEALNVAEADDDIRCVILQGDGSDFCSGGPADRRVDHGDRDAAQAPPSPDRFDSLVEALRVFPKPVIASVEGAATGSGFLLALACDLIVAAENARFVASGAQMGSSAADGPRWQLLRAVPRHRLMQMLCVAEPATARQLQDLGIVNRMADSGQALAQALHLAKRLAAEASADELADLKERVRQWPPHR